jgi:glycine hydroxymethyltransferase
VNYEILRTVDPEIEHLLKAEEYRQATGLELIASENYASVAVLEAMSSVLNNKYSEGYPGNRYYGGQEVTDRIEVVAIERAKALFRCGFANVQPHAGAPANVASYFALLKPGEKVLGMDLSHGGHLTHGHPVTHVAKVFPFIRYKMKDVGTGEIDYDLMRKVALEERPRIVLAGFSAYPRNLDYAAMRSIAEEVGAYAVADVAHIAGLIVADVLPNPFDFGFDVVLTTTHKTLRGPRGGMILSRTEEIATKIDKAVFPGLQGGPIMQMIAAKAVAFHEAQQPAFKSYAQGVVTNAKAFADEFSKLGVSLVTGGTDNHLLLIDGVKSWGLSGQEIQEKLDVVGISTNKNMIPDDPRKPTDPSGVRVGTPALTTRGLNEQDFREVARLIDRTLRSKKRHDIIAVRNEVERLARRFPVPGT